MNRRTLLRNEVELSPKRFLAEGSTKGVSAQDLRSKFQPIYHQDDRRDMVQYGRPLKEEAVMLGMLSAELIWDAILTLPEREER